MFFAAHRGLRIGEHLIDNEAPVAAAEPVPVPEGAVAETAEDADPGPAEHPQGP